MQGTQLLDKTATALRADASGGSASLLELLRRHHAEAGEPNLAPVSSGQVIEIHEIVPADTSIEVVACNGQIVIVGEKEIVEARATFERLSTGTDRPRIEQIQRAVCERFKVARNDLLSSRRTANVVHPRQIAMYLAKTMTLKSLPEIGRRFGGRDHTTVLHAVRKMSRLVQTNTDVREQVSDLLVSICREAA